VGFIRTREILKAYRPTVYEELCVVKGSLVMKPITTEIRDSNTLQELGLASVQIVHDLKNQLNGLKLYATFLRKRMEKAERPADEQETVSKLIAGLDRAASDMTALVRLGRPLELRRQPHVDLAKMVLRLDRGTEGTVSVEGDPGMFIGEMDGAAVSEALTLINAAALNLRNKNAPPGGARIRLRIENSPDSPTAIVEWLGLRFSENADPFHSFAGSDGVRLSLAAKIISAHNGDASQVGDAIRVRLPISNSRHP
jgi:signal transduction histidine kinase